MDCFELAGEKPMMPAPPKVWPVWPEPVLPDELVPEVDVPVVVLSGVVPVLPVLPVVPLVPPLSPDEPEPPPEVPVVEVEPLVVSDEENMDVGAPVDPLFP